MTGYESKKAMAQDKITDEQGRPMTYWGGKAQPAQEPVAWITPDGEGFRIRFSPPTNDVPLGWDALYAAPPQRKPLTDFDARGLLASKLKCWHRLTKEESVELVELFVGHIPGALCIHEQPAQEPVAGTKTWFEDGKVVTQYLTAKDIYKEPAQEPVAWYHDNFGTLELSRIQRVGWKPLYTTPPQRLWVGLTDDELDVIYEQHHNQYGECESPNWGYERAIEAKLKEKNNGT